MKANEAQAKAALDRPSPDIRLYLLHGPDEAGAAALAQRLAKALGPAAERVDLDAATLKSDPARLADEAASASLFGDTHAYGPEGVQFFTRAKAVTQRWADPSHGGINLGFPENN